MLSHLIDYNVVLEWLLYVLGNQKVHFTCFVVIFTFLWWSGTEPTISLRYTYINCKLDRQSQRHQTLSPSESCHLYMPILCLLFSPREGHPVVEDIPVDGRGRWCSCDFIKQGKEWREAGKHSAQDSFVIVVCSFFCFVFLCFVLFCFALIYLNNSPLHSTCDLVDRNLVCRVLQEHTFDGMRQSCGDTFSNWRRK